MYLQLLILAVLGTTASSRGWVAEEPVSWDGLVFTQQWPITSCIHHEEHTPGSTCNLSPNKTSWTVHGVWPTKIGERGPNFCDPKWPFDESKLNPLMPLLMKYWTNIYAEAPTDSLWEHEWTKHGTCAAEVTLMDSEYKYFSKGLELVQNYDLVSILARKGIYPHDTKRYTAVEVFNAIWSFTQVNPILDCEYNEKTKQHDLSQIKLCFSRTLDLIDCDSLLDQDTPEGLTRVAGDCPDQGIVYPSTVVSQGVVHKYSEELVKKHVDAWHKRHLPTSSLWSKLISYLAGTTYVNSKIS